MLAQCLLTGSSTAHVRPGRGARTCSVSWWYADSSACRCRSMYPASRCARAWKCSVPACPVRRWMQAADRPTTAGSSNPSSTSRRGGERKVKKKWNTTSECRRQQILHIPPLPHNYLERIVCWDSYKEMVHRRCCLVTVCFFRVSLFGKIKCSRGCFILKRHLISGKCRIFNGKKREMKSTHHLNKDQPSIKDMGTLCFNWKLLPDLC